MRVLAWPAFKYYGLNPYTYLLYTSLKKLDVETFDFSFKSAFLKRYDIFHIHWPEYYAVHEHTLKAAVGILMTLSAIWWQRFLGAKVVWTVHNLSSHNKTRPHLERWLWSVFTRSIDGYFCLTNCGLELVRKEFPVMKGLPAFVIPHGHYRGHYESTVSRDEARSRLSLDSRHPVILYFGSIAQYKNVPELIRTFRETFPEREITLVIAGACASPEYAASLAGLAENDSRIKFFLEFIPEDQVQLFLNASDLVVLPFSSILNSGSAILSLSFDRPVLVPEQGAMPELQKVSGPKWVKTFPGRLQPGVLRSAVRWAMSEREPRPDLSELDWEMVAVRTKEAYGRILALA